MRTTVDIPDETYRRLKVKAAEENSTVRQVVLEGLDLVLLQQNSAPPAQRLKLPLIRSTRKDKLIIDNEKIYEIIDFP
ncbi:MAG: hypothetical protein P4K93_09945 [Terracidiphilus sp.]|nr:hypothetical protein [Terracidiphilus sp.]MDR3798465.1 hypothetical protein [Terracidiphilus sp.]